MTPDELREDWSNRSAFIDRGLRCEPVEGYRGDVAFTADDIVEVILCRDVANPDDYSTDMRAVVRLDDGRWAYMLNSCCSCGFDDPGQAWVTDDYDRLIQFGVGEEGLARLPELPRDLDALQAWRDATGGAS